MDNRLKQVIHDEYKRCASDPVHFFKKYGIIQHPKKGKINFNLYEFQEKTLSEFKNHRYTIVLKGRQLGLSTLVAAYALWKMLFTDDFKVLVIATTQDVAKELVAKVQLMYEKLPVWLKKTAQKDVFNKLELTFKNGSAVKAVSSSEKSARSPSISLLIVDEAAFVDKMDEIWTAAQATLACIDYNSLVLTPRGLLRIGELSNPNYKFGFNEHELEIVNIDGDSELSDSYFISEESDVYEVTLRNGNTIIATEEHPLYTQDGWKRISELSVGMGVKCIYNTQLFGEKIDYPSFKSYHLNDHRVDNVSNEDLAYFYGLYVAEGNRGSYYPDRHAQIKITNVDDDIQSFLADKFNFKLYDDRHMSVFNAHLSHHMAYVGLDYSTDKDKKVPSKILCASKSEQIEFLRGLFDGDGCATTRGSIKYTSISNRLVLDIQQMLFNFGIRSNVKYVEGAVSKTSIIYKNNPTYVYRGYNLTIYGNDATKFFDIIGFRLQRKQSRRIEYKNGEYIPVDVELIRKVIDGSGYTYNYVKYNIANVTRLLYRGANSITRFSMEALLSNISCEVDGWNDLNTVYNEYINNKFFYEDIVAIEYIDKRITYDLKVPESHSFIANSIVNHNTGGDCILLSTPNGVGNVFHQIWVDAEEGTFDPEDEPFNPIRLPWSLHPDRDESWAKREQAKLGARRFAQEHNCLGGDSMVTVRNVNTGEVKNISLRELYGELS